MYDEVFPHSQCCCSRRSTSVPYQLFGLNAEGKVAEIPNTSECGCKVQMVRVSSYILKYHSEHCIIQGVLFMLLHMLCLPEFIEPAPTI